MPKTTELTDDAVLELFKSRWLTSSEAAAVLGIVPGAVRKMMFDNPDIRDRCRRIGRDWFIPRRVIAEYARTKARKAEPRD